jgi:hypothetical protein
MLIFEWATPCFEVVVERHERSMPLRVERLPREVLLDLGKFSCAVTIFCRKGSVTATLLPIAGAIVLGFLIGLTTAPLGAGTETPPPRPWTSH